MCQNALAKLAEHVRKTIFQQKDQTDYRWLSLSIMQFMLKLFNSLLRKIDGSYKIGKEPQHVGFRVQGLGFGALLW